MGSITLDSYVHLEHDLASRGITITTLAVAQTANALCWHQLAEVYNAAGEGWPDPDPGSRTAITADEMRLRIMRLNTLPEAFFIAKHEHQSIGFSGLAPSAAHVGVAHSSGTAVHPAYRNIGVATALKVRCLAFAREHRFVRLTTATAHPGMLRINERLGFEPGFTEVRLVRDLRKDIMSNDLPCARKVQSEKDIPTKGKHMGKLDVYGSQDPRYLPMYTLSETAKYTGVLKATLRTWVLGRPYPTEDGEKFSPPIIVLPDEGQLMLSFINLVECHVLAAIRRQHHVPLPKVRSALDFINDHFQVKHPLAHHEFRTDGIDLFIEKYGQLINVTRSGQLAMRQTLEAYLKRIEHDQQGVALRLYPLFNRTSKQEAPRVVVIDPRISFGRAVLIGTSVPTMVLAERWKAGESLDELAYDYDRDKLDIEEAIRYELELQAA